VRILDFAKNRVFRQFQHTNIIAPSNIYSVYGLRVPLPGVQVSTPIIQMGGYLSIQEDQDKAYLMASFPYLASASAEPDSFGPSPNTLNRVRTVKIPDSSILAHSNVTK